MNRRDRPPGLPRFSADFRALDRRWLLRE